ncbi:MAG: cation:proton antiporter, partial [Nitrospirae bacterium]|nr:cation:proton antiporter [Fimbriimonadaceae bacterium]
MTDVALAVRFFLQLAVILLVCRAVGWFGRRYLGQTQVVMEMIAGVLLGPSLFGLLAPQAQSWLFPQTAIVGEASIRHPSMSVLYVASQLGLVLYMFLVGLEFETSLLRQKAKGAVSVSLSGIVLPFALGVLASTWMREPGVYFNESAKAWEGAVFMGAAMCITAFPMLARIISERGLAGTTMGTLALAAGATDDAMAWAMLAVVLSSFTSTPSYALWAIGGGALFLCFMLLARPLLQRLEAWTQREGTVTQPIAITTFAIVSLAAWFTDAIGIYAVFGAFVTGVCMPRGEFSKGIRLRV